jgi:uncharacterized membrane protein YhaH (DUF805 family)
MGMGDDGAFDRPPRVDVEIARRAVQALGPQLDQVTGHRRIVRAWTILGEEKTALDTAANPFAERMPPLRIFFSLRGRVSRRQFWLYGVLVLIGLAVLSHALLGIARVPPRQADLIVNLLLVWPALAVSVKRWHDRDKSGGWVLLNLLPVIGWLWALIDNGFLRGTPGPNRFGADPLADGQ